MKNKLIFLCLSAAFLASCRKDVVYKDFHEFKSHSWHKTETVTFETTLNDVSNPYDIDISVRHLSVYPFADVVVAFTIETPAGERRVMEHDLLIRNTDGTFKGDGMGDIYDIDLPAYKNLQLNQAGLYRFTIESRMPVVEMPGISGMGIIIRKSQADK